MLSLGMDGGSKKRRKRRVSRSCKGVSVKKPKRRGVARRVYRKTKRALKKAKKMNRSLLNLITPKRFYN